MAEQDGYSTNSELKRPRQISESSFDGVIWSKEPPNAIPASHPTKRIRNGSETEPLWHDSSGRDDQNNSAVPSEEISGAAQLMENGNGEGQHFASGVQQESSIYSEGSKGNGFHDPMLCKNTNGLSYDDVEEMNEANGRNGAEDCDDDNLSEISNLSGLSVEAWRPTTGPMTWVQRQIEAGTDPRQLLQQMMPSAAFIPAGLDDITLWKIILNLVAEPPRRRKLPDVNTMEDVLQLLKTCKRIMVLTGAGVSVSCGIPDFRSKDGIYSRLSVEYPDLPDPQAMFDIHYFTRNQGPFFKFAKEIYPGQFAPSTSHKFIRLLETHNKLLRNYTQNIDTLEQVAGINNVVQCHGSFATATCMVCEHKEDAAGIKQDIMNQVVPRCPVCPAEEPLGIMKPDIVFFGESLPEHFHRQMEQDKDVCDLLIVMGSSLKVRPVALIPNSLPAEVPQVLINREPLRHLNFDVELLGDCDAIVNELCQRLGEDWTSICTHPGPLRQLAKDEMSTPPMSGHTSPSSSMRGETSPSQSMSVSSTQPPASQHSSSFMSCQTVSEKASGISLLDGECSMDVESKDSSTSVDQRTDSGNTLLHFPKLCSSSEGPLPMDSSSSDLSTNGRAHDSQSPTTGEGQSPSTGATDSPSNTARDMDSQSAYAVSMDSQPNTVVSMDSLPTTAASMDSQSNTAGAMDSKPSGAREGEGQGTVEGRDPEGESVGPGRPDDLADSELEELRACWRPKVINLGARLQAGTFLFLPPNRYVFQGAEVYEDTDDEDNSSVSSKESSLSSNSRPSSPVPLPDTPSDDTLLQESDAQLSVEGSISDSLPAQSLKNADADGSHLETTHAVI